jgi:hypothetical protein
MAEKQSFFISVIGERHKFIKVKYVIMHIFKWEDSRPTSENFQFVINHKYPG